MVLAVPCGFMLAAIEGAMRASEMPTASHRCSSRRRCGSSVLPALLTSVAMLTPLLCRRRWAERALDPARRMPSGHWCPRGPGADLPCTGATPRVLPSPRTERHTPFPVGTCAVSHLPPPHSTGPGCPRQRALRTEEGCSRSLSHTSGLLGWCSLHIERLESIHPTAVASRISFGPESRRADSNRFTVQAPPSTR